MKSPVLRLLLCSVAFSFSAGCGHPGPEGVEVPEFIPQGPFPFVESMDVDMASYDHLDPERKVPTEILSRAVRFFDQNKARITNQRHMTLIDFRQHSSRQRMWIVNMETGRVDAHWTSHGSGSDRNNDGLAERFSNQPGSHASSLGFYLTGTLYTGRNGRSMYLHGLESTNSNAYRRAVVMHGADYVRPGRVGRSQGCPAVERKHIPGMLTKLERGSLLYIHGN